MCMTFLKNKTSFSETLTRGNLSCNFTAQAFTQPNVRVFFGRVGQISLVRNQVALSEEAVRRFYREVFSIDAWVRHRLSHLFRSHEDVSDENHFIGHQIERLVPVSAYISTSSKVLGGEAVLPV